MTRAPGSSPETQPPVAPARPRVPPLAAATLPAAAWTQTFRVRFSHCDPAGIVYFARYFDIIHGIVEDWFEAALGLSQPDMIAQRRTGLGYAHAEADYFAPSINGDILRFAPLIERIGTGSFGFKVHAYRGDTPILRADLVIATTALDTHRSVPLPDDLRSALARYKAACETPA